MKKEKKLSFNYEDILSHIKFIGILFIVVVLGGIYLLLMLKIDNIEKYTITNEVLVEHNGKKVFKGNIKNYKVDNVKSGDIYTIHMKVPDVDINNATIKYDNVNTAVDIYQDNDLIYSIGKDTPKVGIVCHAFNKVPLNKIEKNQEIKMCIRVINGSALSLLPSVHLMDTQDSDLDYFYSMLIYIIMSVYLLVIGFIGVLIASYSRNKDVINKKLIVLSLCDIVCAMYFLSLYQVIPIFSDNLIMDAYCEYITTIGVIVMLNWYLVISNPKGKRVYSIVLTSVSLLFLVIVISLQALRIKPFNDAMNIFLFLIIATAVNFVITFVKNKENVLNKKVILFISCIIMVLVGLYSFIVIFFSNLKENALIVIPIVISIVLSMEFFDLIYEIMQSMVTAAQKQALMDMAYIDKFTGLFNRRGLDIHIKECIENSYDVYLFDINDLKRINDSYGHGAGDYIIKNFANELKAVFVNGFCARIGGDEFIVICDEKKKINNQLEKLKKNIKCINKESDKEYVLEYAVGSSKYIPMKNSIEDAIKEADNEMYKMKRKKN